MIRVLALLFAAATLLACSSDVGQWHKVGSARVELKVEASGELASADTMVIEPPTLGDTWSFTIGFMVPEGSNVEQGAALLGFDDKTQRDALQRSAGELAEKQRQLEAIGLSHAQRVEEDRLALAELKMKLDKAQRKADQPEGIVAGIEYRKLHVDLAQAIAVLALEERRQTSAELARNKERAVVASDIERLSNDVARYTSEVERLQIKAPKAGIVVYRNDFKGNKIVQGDQVYLGQAVLELPDLARMLARIRVPEREAGRLRIGQDVRLTLDASKERQFRGRLTSIGKVFRSKSRNQPAIVLDAEVEILDPDPALMRPGMTLRADIVTAVEAQALRIPLRAVRINAGRTTALVDGALGGREVAVELGERSGEFFVVRSGLAEGDRVWLR